MTLTRSLLPFVMVLVLGGCFGNSWSSGSSGPGSYEECPWGDSEMTVWGCAFYGGDGSDGSVGGGGAYVESDFDHAPIELRSVEVSGDFSSARDLHLEPVEAEAYRSYGERDVIEVTAQPSAGPSVVLRAAVAPGFWVQSLQPWGVLELDEADLADSARMPHVTFVAHTEQPSGVEHAVSPKHLVFSASPGRTSTSREIGFSATFDLDDDHGIRFGEQTVNLIFEAEQP